VRKRKWQCANWTITHNTQKQQKVWLFQINRRTRHDCWRRWWPSSWEPAQSRFCAAGNATLLNVCMVGMLVPSPATGAGWGWYTCCGDAVEWATSCRYTANCGWASLSEATLDCDWWATPYELYIHNNSSYRSMPTSHHTTATNNFNDKFLYK